MDIFAWDGINLDWAYSDLFNHIRRKIACPHRAKDLLHDAILYFAVSKNPQRQQMPHAYLRGIVAHLLVNEYRQQAKFVLLEDHHQDDLEHAHSPEFLADLKQRLCLLQEIIDHLPARCREAFWLFQVEEMDHRSIAQQMGVSVNMVERHIIRAMLDLRAAKNQLL